MQHEFLEGLDTGLAPALLLLPFYHQHVVSEYLPKHQGLAGVRLLVRLLRHFQLQVCSLRKDGDPSILKSGRNFKLKNYNSHEPLGLRAKDKKDL